MNEALLIIDMQIGCKNDTACKEEFDAAVQYINAASALFREKGRPVVVVQDLEVGAGPGSEGFNVVPEIDRAASDILVQKKFNNAFWQTNLEGILKDLGVSFVVVSGFAAEYCVVFSYNGAVERGFNASLLQHGVAGVHKENIERIQLLRPVVSLQALEHMLNQ